MDDPLRGRCMRGAESGGSRPQTTDKGSGLVIDIANAKADWLRMHGGAVWSGSS